MYYITKEGISLQSVNGPYKTVEQAEKAFWKAYQKTKKKLYNALYFAYVSSYAINHNDFDGYHRYYIVKNLGKFTGESALGKNRVKELVHIPLNEKSLSKESDKK